MHPEMSLVLLTVLAGAGQGLFILLVLLNEFFLKNGLNSEFIWVSVICSVLLQLAGVFSSTSHLGNPHRGWRAVAMIKNSWLSKEVLTLSFSVMCTFLYFSFYWLNIPDIFRLAAGLTGVIFCAGFYLSSSMVYASVRFIKEWSNTLTPVNFLLFGITSGFSVSLAIMHYTGFNADALHNINYLLVLLGTLSLILKSLAFRLNSKLYTSINMKNAIGINDPEIRLMDTGTSYEHYNTKEYFYPITSGQDRALKALVLIFAFTLPLAAWLLMLSGYLVFFNKTLSLFAAISMISGLIVERRLFFIHGNNLQNLYYSNFRRTGALNPLLSKSRKGTPSLIK